ncbi:E3 ubiquitin-protein ligase TRIM31-like [Hyalella azteca]|uniref:E3 ubiquitin-protein ligase TRIM31-like n=1 Tax=Hyalella azteca TaxID=294128 RepID=A0A979FXD3_HYAAZ|nr:E3 ubiquitin-protein ligase TRIM31-like [Hyalella azteca]
MATAMAVCEICDEDFDTEDHKPMCLTCGHTYCVSCITSLSTVHGAKSCPKCRKKIRKPTNELLVNYSLIPSKNKACKQKKKTESKPLCSQHDRQLDYLCVSCIKFVCFTCTRGIHGEHKIEVVNNLLQNADADSKAKIQSAIVEKIKRLKKNLQVSQTLISDIIQLRADVDEWNDFLEDQIRSTKSDLMAWNALASSVGKKNSVECEEILQRLTSEPSENKLPEIKRQLSRILRNVTPTV